MGNTNIEKLFYVVVVMVVFSLFVYFLGDGELSWAGGIGVRY